MVLQEVHEQGMMIKKDNYFTNMKELKNIKTIHLTPVTCTNSRKKNVLVQWRRA